MTGSTDFAEAIRSQCAARAADAVLLGKARGDAEMARAVRDACSAISQRMLGTRAEILEACRNASIMAEAVTGPEDTGELQYHTTSIRLAPGALATMLGVAGDFGFRPPLALGPGQIEAIARYVPNLTLVRADDATSRIVLRIEGQRSSLPSVLRPRLVDIAMTDAGPGRSARYPLFRLRRIVGERLSGRRSPSSDSDFLGTPDSLVAPLLDWLAPGPDDVLFDLGCGDGRIVVTAAERYGCRCVGVEANPDLVAAARARVAQAGPDIADRVEISEGFIEEADLSRATIIFLFLPSYLVARFFEKVRGGSMSGIRILAHEQTGLHGLPPPSETRPIIGAEGITIAHLWRV
jgi:hypothetical protein